MFKQKHLIKNKQKKILQFAPPKNPVASELILFTCYLRESWKQAAIETWK